MQNSKSQTEVCEGVLVVTRHCVRLGARAKALLEDKQDVLGGRSVVGHRPVAKGRVKLAAIQAEIDGPATPPDRRVVQLVPPLYSEVFFEI